MTADVQPGAASIDGVKSPYFSVILPTRNRPELLRRALVSVLRQNFTAIEVLVVNDGSSPQHLAAYAALQTGCDARVSWLWQPPRANGHGPSYSINSGAEAARGEYLCILDDDDSWEDDDHLTRAHQALSASANSADVYYSNQTAYTADGKAVATPLWLGVLAQRLPPIGAQQAVSEQAMSKQAVSEQASTEHGVHRVTADFLLGCNGFPHLNCTIIRRQLYLDLGGMDEGIRYECEVDLYLRSLAAADHILYTPAIIARHNVPDAVGKTSVSTAVSALEKQLSQIRVYQKNLARNPPEAIRNDCLAKLTMLHKRVARTFIQQGNYTLGAVYARTALACGYSLKWQLYCLYLAGRAAIAR